MGATHDLGNPNFLQVQLDGVLIELTGMADPAPVVQTFIVDPEAHTNHGQRSQRMRNSWLLCA